MDWYSFLFGVATGVCVVLLVGGGIFVLLLRPYLKAARGGGKSRATSPPPDLWLKHMEKSTWGDQSGWTDGDGTNQ